MNLQVDALSDTTRKLVSLISQCCIDCRRQPVDLRVVDFRRWLKSNYELTPKDLQEIDTHIISVGGFNVIKDSFFTVTPSVSAIEKMEMRSVAKLNRAEGRGAADDERFLARLERIMVPVSKELAKIKQPQFKAKKNTKTERHVTLMLTDLHLGSDLNEREVPYRFGFEEEARALASLVVTTNEFKVDHRSESVLNIWIGGDATEGKLHDKQAGRPSAEQSADAIWLLTQVISSFATNWKQVNVRCDTGNHGRNQDRHFGRASNAKWDSIETVIFFGIKTALQHLPNVNMEISRTAYSEWTVFDHNIFATHGDTTLEVGMPGKAVPIASIDSQMKSINLSRVDRKLEPYKVFLAGHIHQALRIPLPSGELLLGGTLLPVNGYGQSIGYFSSRPTQILFESTAQYAVGDARFIHIQPEVLKDKSLEKIIVPFKDF